MAKYHIGKDNKIRICKATKTNCPLQHFYTKEEAETYLNKILEENNGVLVFENEKTFVRPELQPFISHFLSDLERQKKDYEDDISDSPTVQLLIDSNSTNPRVVLTAMEQQHLPKNLMNGNFLNRADSETLIKVLNENGYGTKIKLNQERDGRSYESIEVNLTGMYPDEEETEINVDSQTSLADYVSPNKEEEEFAKNLSQKESWITRVNGVKKIQDEKLLVKYFNDDIEDVRMQVAKRLRDDDLIINHFVKETDASDVTEEVVKSLQNEDLIVKHFANSRYWSVKIAVIKKLSDEDKIIKLFAKDKDEDIRISAAARIKDKERLLKHFAKDKSDKVRLEVLKKMKNKKDIEAYFLNDKAYMVRSFAKKKLGINDY